MADRPDAADLGGWLTLWPTLSILVKGLLTILLVMAGGYAALRPKREVEKRINDIWTNSFYYAENRLFVAVAALILIGVIWVL